MARCARPPARARPQTTWLSPAGRLTLHCALAACAQDMKAAENMDFISQGSTNNALCFLGPHRRFDPFTKSFMCARPAHQTTGCRSTGSTPLPPARAQVAHPRTRSLWPRCHSWRRKVAPGGERVAQGARLPRPHTPAPSHTDAPWPQFRRPRATRWSASSLRSTRRWSTRSARRAPAKTKTKTTLHHHPISFPSARAREHLFHPLVGNQQICACVCVRQGIPISNNPFWRRVKTRSSKPPHHNGRSLLSFRPA